MPLVTGGCVGLLHGQRLAWLALFIVTAVAFFCLRTPLEVWLESSPLRARTDEEREVVVLSMVVYATLGGLALAVLLLAGDAHALLALGAVAVAAFLAQSLLRKMERRLRLVAQLVGCIGLTSGRREATTLPPAASTHAPVFSGLSTGCS